MHFKIISEKSRVAPALEPKAQNATYTQTNNMGKLSKSNCIPLNLLHINGTKSFNIILTFFRVVVNKTLKLLCG